MGWSSGTIESALVGMREEFDQDQNCEEVALVWREPGEYKVLPGWIIRHFREHLDWRELKVVMFLSRDEYTWLMEMLKEGIICP